MTPRELLADLRARGIELELAPDGRRFRPRRPVDPETRRLLERERLWLLMALAHEAGGDTYDPRLAFLAEAERGLTAGAVVTRMEIAFGITRELATKLVDFAEYAGFLRRRGELLEPVGDVAMVLQQREVLPA